MADAVVYNLLVIGEAVKALDAGVRDAHPEVPWADIAGMRDLLAHEYFRVAAGIVEQTVRRDLAPLERAVERILGQAAG